MIKLLILATEPVQTVLGHFPNLRRQGSNYTPENALFGTRYEIIESDELYTDIIFLA